MTKIVITVLPAEINPRADWHLDNWARWLRTFYYGKGYPGRSAGLSCGGISGTEAFDHLCDEADKQAAKITDTIVGDLSDQHQSAIFTVYTASPGRNRGDPLNILADAIGEFWVRATRQGLS